MTSEFDWRWENLPKGIKENVQGWVDTNNFRELIKLHYKYNLSDHSYCCGLGGKQAHSWFKWGLENDKIK